MSKRYTYLAILVGAVCVYFITRLIFFPRPRTVSSDLIQVALVGFGLAFASDQVYARIKAKKVNGWITMYGLGEPRNGMLLRAAHAQLFLGPVNLPQESMYWWTNSDGAGRALSGEHEYVIHFPAGGLPPNQAFWSITMGDARNNFVANPLNRYSVSGRTGLASRRTPMARLTSTSRTPLRRDASPTGCPRLRASSSSGCACTSPARPFSGASIRCRR